MKKKLSRSEKRTGNFGGRRKNRRFSPTKKEQKEFEKENK